MTKEAFDSIMAGAQDALAYAKGDKSRGRATTIVVPTVDTKALRKRLKMSQDRFATSFFINVETLRKWEQGVRHPDTSARALLTLIERDPSFVQEALAPLHTRVIEDENHATT